MKFSVRKLAMQKEENNLYKEMSTCGNIYICLYLYSVCKKMLFFIALYSTHCIAPAQICKGIKKHLTVSCHTATISLRFAAEWWRPRSDTFLNTASAVMPVDLGKYILPGVDPTQQGMLD